MRTGEQTKIADETVEHDPDVDTMLKHTGTSKVKQATRPDSRQQVDRHNTTKGQRKEIVTAIPSYSTTRENY